MANSAFYLNNLSSRVANPDFYLNNLSSIINLLLQVANSSFFLDSTSLSAAIHQARTGDPIVEG